MKKRTIVISCLTVVIVAALAVLWMLFFAGSKEYAVGTDIQAEDITEFYYTTASSAYPPDYQRYYIYAQDGYFFYHERREGEHFPLRESDIAESGTVALTEDEWNAFLELLQDGVVVSREENTSSGGSGPWLYLYWKKDKGKIRQFSFASYAKENDFVEFCVRIKNAQR